MKTEYISNDMIQIWKIIKALRAFRSLLILICYGTNGYIIWLASYVKTTIGSFYVCQFLHSWTQGNMNHCLLIRYDVNLNIQQVVQVRVST